jgi:ribonucleoside-diphosphate reductase alpha chain
MRWLLRSLDFPPNGPTLLNAGIPLGQRRACIVLPADASAESFSMR